VKTWAAFTPAKREALIKLLKQGNHRDTACRAVGIGRRTLYNWLTRGATGEGEYGEFAQQVIAAEAEAESVTLSYVLNAVPEDWRAGAWFLARKFPEHWAERPAPPPETKTAEVAAAELAELLTQAGWKVTPPDDSADGHGAQGDPATPRDSVMKQPAAEAEDE
jgi:hypothetical protein